VKRWARIATAGVAVLAGAALVLAALTIEALAEGGESSAPGVVLGLGAAAILFGAATVVVPWARYGALAVLGAVFVLAYSGELADDVVYEAIAGVALVLLGTLALIGHRGAPGSRAARRASAGAAVSPDAPNAESSTQDAERDGRARRS
jgi:hypothetical protein